MKQGSAVTDVSKYIHNSQKIETLVICGLFSVIIVYDTDNLE